MDISIELLIESLIAVWAREQLQAQVAPDMLLHVCNAISFQFFADQTKIFQNLLFFRIFSAICLCEVLGESLFIAQVLNLPVRPSTFACFCSRLDKVYQSVFSELKLLFLLTFVSCS